MKQSIRYSIIIPAYNEEQRLAPTLETVMRYIAERCLSAEIVVVDDGSTDRTVEVANRYQASAVDLRVLQLQHRGKGSAVRQGFAAARGEIVLLCDADLNQGFLECEKLERALQAGANIAIGSRWAEKCDCDQPGFRRASSRLFNLCTQYLLRLNFHDTQCGLKAFEGDVARELCDCQSNRGWGFDAELLFLAKRLGYYVVEVPVRFHHDYSSSKFRPLRDGLACFMELLQILWRQLLENYPYRTEPRTSAGRIEAQPATANQTITISRLPESADS